jgi:small subunit ribosomal protein S8
MMTDPVADLLARIRNAGQAGHAETTCPSSKMKLAVAKVLVEAGYLDTVQVESLEGKPQLRIGLRYTHDRKLIIDGMRRISKPSRRVYVGTGQIPKVRNGLGIAVLSTAKGVLSDSAAREANVGGEVVCEVW